MLVEECVYGSKGRPETPALGVEKKASHPKNHPVLTVNLKGITQIFGEVPS